MNPIWNRSEKSKSDSSIKPILHGYLFLYLMFVNCKSKGLNSTVNFLENTTISLWKLSFVYIGVNIPGVMALNYVCFCKTNPFLNLLKISHLYLMPNYYWSINAIARFFIFFSSQNNFAESRLSFQTGRKAFL